MIADEHKISHSIIVRAMNHHQTDVKTLGNLLLCGASPNAFAWKGGTPLREASEQGLLPVCELLVQSRADVNLRDGGDQSVALHGAARQGHLTVCRWLLGQRANPNVWNRKQLRTPLAYARANSHAEVAELLVEHGAYLNVPHWLRSRGLP